MEKKKILFVINQFFKGGAEVALLNLFKILPQEKYEIDFLIFDQIPVNNAISLIDEIPEQIHVFDAAASEGKMALAKKAVFKMVNKLTHQQKFRRNVYEFLQDKTYDVAISYGEWFSSELVAIYANTKRKYVWIHADIDKANFLHPDIAKYQQYFDKFIFVSEQSMNSAFEKYVFLKYKSIVIHNCIDEKSVIEKSEESLETISELPILVTVANIRAEKNHLRQVAVMQELFARGIKFQWLNVGSMADTALTAKVKNAVTAAGLNDYFHLLGARENPYVYMKQATAVCVLSDHESWSMVITEAKTLGIPVISTKTSGALEQLVHQETGILCDFTIQSIADAIQSFLTNKSLQQRMRIQLQKFSSAQDTLHQLDMLLDDSRKKILYVFDDVNYVSGARNASFAQLDILSENRDITVFSAEPCRDTLIKERYQVLDLQSNQAFQSLSVPFADVIKADEYSIKVKLLRVVYAFSARIQQDDKIYHLLLREDVRALFEQFDVVCVVSEASKLRSIVSSLKNPKKIQWIHTDYAAWQQHNAWTRAITKNDEELYSRYDNIVLLSEHLKEKFDIRYPSLQSKTVAIPNLIQWETILEKANEPSNVVVDKNKFNIITIGRLEKEKQHTELLKVAKSLKNEGLYFQWFFVGDGCLKDELKEQCRQLNLENNIVFTGNMVNPYPLLKQCDLFVLMSEYEGTPVTIDEAKVLGVPVLANDVGGIRDQLVSSVYGSIIERDNLIKIVLLFAKNKKNRIEKNDYLLKHNEMVKKKLQNLI